MLQTSDLRRSLPFRPGDFANFRESLDYAALSDKGLTIYSGRGDVVEAIPYRELAAQAQVLGRKMLRLGLEPGDRVALIADSDGSFIRLFFACQYVGLVPAPLPLPTAFAGRATYLDHLRSMIAAAAAAAVFAPPNLEQWLEQAVDGLNLIFAGTAADLDAVPEEDCPLPEVADDAIAYLQFSSGSTRFPMGVAVTQKALMNNIGAIARHGLKVTGGDRAVSWLPLYHDMGLVGFLLTPVASQLSLDLMATREFAKRPMTWLKLISDNGGTLSFSPSFGYELCARRAEMTAPPPDIDLSSWRVAGIGGDMIRPKVLERFVSTFGRLGFRETAFVPSYGMAEATLAVSFAPLGRAVAVDRLDMDRLEQDGSATLAAKQSARVREFVRCGQLLPGFEAEIRGTDGKVLEDRAVGLIFLKGPSLMLAYYRQPEATQAILDSDGWLDTGDIGYWADGELVITGRTKDLIQVKGRNIAPQDLEWTAEHEVNGLRSGDTAAVSVDDGESELVVILVQCRMSEAARRASLQEEVESVIRKLHGVDCRAVLVPHNSLPYTSSGKLSRSHARQLFLDNAFGQRLAAGAK